MKILNKYIVLVCIAMSLYSCEKELGALPPNDKVDANTILDQGTAQIALNGAYYTFANATQALTQWQDHRIRPGMLAGYLSYGYSPFPEEDNLNNSLSHYWAESYILINAANGVIKGLNALPEGKIEELKMKEMIAEARFLRAYGHFKLLTYYGEWYNINSNFGILIRNEHSALGNIVKARSSVKESYDFIIDDLDYAIANGPTTNPNHYATRWAGMALKARVLMSRGGVADYPEVITLTKNIIDDGGYELEPNSIDLFRNKGLTSKEVILGIKPQAGQELDVYSKSRDYIPGGSYLYTATARFKNLLNDDPRQAWQTGVRPPNTLNECYYFTKYLDVNGIPSAVSETDYAFRLTEVYLLQAEAIVRSGGSLTDAKNVLHIIQARAGITATTNNIPYLQVEAANTSTTLLLEIFKENVKSLTGEDGIEWLALLRLPFETVKSLKPTIINQTQYILPVPASEFVYNPSFGLQNPGYNTN